MRESPCMCVCVRQSTRVCVCVSERVGGPRGPSTPPPPPPLTYYPPPQVSTEESGLAAIECAYRAASQAASLLKDDLALKVANTTANDLAASTSTSTSPSTFTSNPPTISTTAPSGPPPAYSAPRSPESGSRLSAASAASAASTVSSSSRVRPSLTGRVRVGPRSPGSSAAGSRRGHPHPVMAPLKPSRTAGSAQGTIGGYAEGSIRRLGEGLPRPGELGEL